MESWKRGVYHRLRGRMMEHKKHSSLKTPVARMFAAPESSLEFLKTVETSPPDKYIVLGKIAEGGYGIISKAMIKGNEDAGLFVLKRNRYEGFKGVVTVIDMNEVKVLMKLREEKNVVRLIELVRDEKQFTLVLEYCRVDLTRILYGKVALTVGDIKNLLLQLFQGIKAMHARNIMHRDLKPANLLLSCDGILKITDFGNSVEMGTLPRLKTDVCTIWYMSPELIFGHAHYNQTVDIWSAGCTAAEFFTRTPAIFKGADVFSQMEKISELCGFCSESVWPEAKSFPNYNSLHKALGKYTENNLQEFLLKATRHVGAANFLSRLLKLNATQRISADEAINDVYFQSAPSASPDLSQLLHFLDIKRIGLH